MGAFFTSSFFSNFQYLWMMFILTASNLLCQVMMWEWRASRPSSSATLPTWRTTRENASSMTWPSLPRTTWAPGAREKVTKVSRS